MITHITKLNNWKPITLLHNDAEAFAYNLCKETEKGHKIIDEEQFGFVKGDTSAITVVFY